jgi:hypothetical protein
MSGNSQKEQLMEMVESFEVKTHLPQPLERAAISEEFI